MSKRNDITDGIFATTKKYGLVGNGANLLI